MISAPSRFEHGVPIEQATAGGGYRRPDRAGIPESGRLAHKPFLFANNIAAMTSTRLMLCWRRWFVLLIACVTSQIYAGSAANREREIAIRVALGSGRLRLVRQLLTESVVLALMGGGAGLLLAFWGVDVLTAIAPADVPRLAEVKIDLRVLAFTIGTSVLTAILFGLIPALHASKVNLNESLKEGGRSATEGARGGRIRTRWLLQKLSCRLC